MNITASLCCCLPPCCLGRARGRGSHGREPWGGDEDLGGGWGGAGVIRSIWALLPSLLWSLSTAAPNSGSLSLLCLSLLSPFPGESQQAYDQPAGHTAPFRPLYRPQREQDSRWCPQASQDRGTGSILSSYLGGFAQSLSKAWVGTERHGRTFLTISSTPTTSRGNGFLLGATPATLQWGLGGDPDLPPRVPQQTAVC